MITIDGKQFRNLEEQVLKNKQDIAQHYQAMQLPLNLAGINVIGEIEDPLELDYISGDNYGDAYVQVAGNDTTLWIWTRANEAAGHAHPYWLSIPFTTVGPTGAPGAVGPQGPQGIRGSRWFSGTGQPTSTGGDYQLYDYYINVQTGNIWHLHRLNNKLTWQLEGNITGPQGPVGPQGPQGPQGERGPLGRQGPRGQAGAAVLIAGILSSAAQLPAYSDIQNPNLAYLVGTEAPYILWIQEAYRFSGGNVVDTRWVNVGEFGAGTTVFVGGEPVSTFDADTKLSIPNISAYSGDVLLRINGYTKRVQPTVLSGQPEDSAVPTWDENGCLKTNWPRNDEDCVNVRYMYDRNRTVIGHTVNLILFNTSDESVRTLLYKQINHIDESIMGSGPDAVFSFYNWIIGWPLIDETTKETVMIESVERRDDNDEVFIVKLRGENYEYETAFDDNYDDLNYIYEP